MNWFDKGAIARSAVTGTVAAVVLAGAVVSDAARADAATCWYPPVEAIVRDPFREPGCPWCPGNRGIEYATRPGQPVTAVAAGRVSFVGSVAGTTYVVVDVGGGRRVTYGRLIEARPERGAAVAPGQVIGRADTGFHFGVRVGERYVDPAPSLGRLVHRARLVPTDGGAAPPAPPPVLVCRDRSPVAVGANVRRPGSMVGRFTVR